MVVSSWNKKVGSLLKKGNSFKQAVKLAKKNPIRKGTYVSRKTKAKPKKKISAAVKKSRAKFEKFFSQNKKYNWSIKKTKKGYSLNKKKK